MGVFLHPITSVVPVVDVVPILLSNAGGKSRSLAAEARVVPILLKCELFLDAHGVQEMTNQTEA
jgi:hypothetical protein